MVSDESMGDRHNKGDPNIFTLHCSRILTGSDSCATFTALIAIHPGVLPVDADFHP